MLRRRDRSDVVDVEDVLTEDSSSDDNPVDGSPTSWLGPDDVPEPGTGTSFPSGAFESLPDTPSDPFGTGSDERQAPAPAWSAHTQEAPSSKPQADNGAPRRRLGEILVGAHLIGQDQLAEALLEQSATGKRIGAVLVELGALEERDLAKVLSDQFGLEVVDLRQQAPEPEAIALVPEDLARSWSVVPLRQSESTLEVATADPMEDGAKQALTELLAGTPRVLVLKIAPLSDIRRAIDNSYRALSGVGRHVETFANLATERTQRQQEALLQVDEQAPVVQVVNLLLTQALRDRASDVHIEPTDKSVRVRFRIDGALQEAVTLPGSMGPALVSRIKILGGMNIVERRKPQDGQIDTVVEDKPVDIRVSTAPTVFGEKVVMRLLDKSRPMFKLEDLGMRSDLSARFSALAHSPFGMVLCAGPTGSGKTTTLYATLGEINAPDLNVTTIEDPVEYVLPSINQIPINEQAEVTFADGLRAILRQDPDVILVGEIRDVETARIAIQSALTGHLVLSSVHATDAASTLHRFLDMGIEPFLIASSVTGIVSQRLLRRICSACKVPFRPAPDEMAFLRQAGVDKTDFWHGAGCNFCAHTGYRDRIGVFEVMNVTDDIKELVVARASHQDIRDFAMEQGMTTLQQEAVRLIEEDMTTVAEVMRSIYVV